MFERNPYLYIVSSTISYSYPASSLVSIGPDADGKVTLYFTPLNVQHENGPGANAHTDTFQLGLRNDFTHKDIMEKLVNLINGSKDPFIVVVDEATGEVFDQALDGTVTSSVQTTVTDTVTQTTIPGGVTWYSHGTGFTSTGSAAVYEGRRFGPERETTILLDLQGLSNPDNVVTDAIGLHTGGEAYIGRYTSGSIDGYFPVITRVEFTCLELPTVSAGALLKDFDLVKATDKTHVFDTDLTAEGGYGVIAEMGGNIALNQTIVVNNPGQATDNDYLYLKAGAAANGTGTDGLFTAGKLQIKIYSRETY